MNNPETKRKDDRWYISAKPKVMNDVRVSNLEKNDKGNYVCNLSPGFRFRFFGESMEAKTIYEIAANLEFYTDKVEPLQNISFRHLNPLFENQYFTAKEIDRWNKYLEDNQFIWDEFFKIAINNLNKGHQLISSRGIISEIRKNANPKRPVDDHVSPFLAYAFIMRFPHHSDKIKIKKRNPLFKEEVENEQN